LLLVLALLLFLGEHGVKCLSFHISVCPVCPIPPPPDHKTPAA
jgi:hypothetical protein